MEKQLLGEVNRVREIMGLEVITEQEENKEVDYTKILKTPAYQDLNSFIPGNSSRRKRKIQTGNFKRIKKS